MFVQKSQGTKDAMVDAKVSTSECSTEATSTEFVITFPNFDRFLQPKNNFKIKKRRALNISSKA